LKAVKINKNNYIIKMRRQKWGMSIFLQGRRTYHILWASFFYF
jgi:hypothetical protein